LSVAVAVIVIGGRTTAPVGATTVVMTGGVLSMKNARVAVAVAPVRSVAVTTSVWAPAFATWEPGETGVPSRVAVTPCGLASVTVQPSVTTPA
jgi:hypothetical protein